MAPSVFKHKGKEFVCSTCPKIFSADEIRDLIDQIKTGKAIHLGTIRTLPNGGIAPGEHTHDDTEKLDFTGSLGLTSQSKRT